MRVTIDAVPLLLRSSGVKNYLYYWVRDLMVAGAIDLRLFPLLGEPALLDHEGSVANPLSSLARLSTLWALNRLPEFFSRPLLPHTDIFHALRLLHPPRRPKLTATIYDLTCWITPETHSKRNIEAEFLVAERIWKRAAGLIAISESTRNDAVRLLKIPERKIRVIYPGVPEAYSLAGDADADSAKQRLGLRKPYLLYVGTIEPRKNVDRLLDAYAGLPPSVRQEFELLLAGPRGWASAATFARLEDPQPGVRYLGYVAENLLPGLFAGATVFLYPSLYEGFGFPVAQAMAAGVPVITSDGSCLGEITGGAARLVDPRSVAELSGAMRDLVLSPVLRSRLRALGRTRGARFTWAACVRESVDFFQAVAAGDFGDS